MASGSLQIKGDYYYIVYRDENKKQRWKSTRVKVGRTKKEQTLAKKLAAEELKKFFNKPKEKSSSKAKVKNDVPKKEPSPPDEMRLTDLLKLWMEDVKPIIKPSTWENYDKTVNNTIIPYFRDNDYPLCDLRPAIFTKYFVYLRDVGGAKCQGVSKKTIKNIKGVLSSACKYGVENEFLESNPIDKARLPVFNDIEAFEPTIYTPEQVKRLLDFAEENNSHASLFIHLIAVTGARRGEILGLTWEDIDFDQSVIHIRHNMVGTRKEVVDRLTTPKTKNSIRTVSIPPKVMTMLQAEKKKQEECRRLFKSHYEEYDYDLVIRQDNGRRYHPNNMNQMITRIMEEAGLPHCRIHDIRHFVASQLFESNVPLKDITTLLGHGQTSTTEKIYIHRNKYADNSNGNLIANILGIND